MSEDTREIEAALGSLQPRRLPAGLEARLGAALARPEASPRRPRVIPFVAWSAGACAACLAFYLAMPGGSGSPEVSGAVATADILPAPAAPTPARNAPRLMMAESRSAPAAAKSASVADPGLRLVRAEQAPSEVTLLEPVRLADGLFARPVRVRWQNAAHYRDARGGAELVRHAPHDEVIGLVPFETD